MGDMQVSVAMINYNYGRNLREAIDSALDQTVAPLEIVVVDDGSTDESRSVLREYGDQIVTVLTENRGPTAATNTALEHCSGEIVCRLDSDDPRDCPDFGCLLTSLWQLPFLSSTRTRGITSRKVRHFCCLSTADKWCSDLSNHVQGSSPSAPTTYFRDR